MKFYSGRLGIFYKQDDRQTGRIAVLWATVPLWQTVHINTPQPFPNNFCTVPYWQLHNLSSINVDCGSTASHKILPTLLVRTPWTVITSGVDKMRTRGFGRQMNKSVAINFLHKQHSQVSKQRIQSLFIDL